jgi:3-phosphoshikimate 1-carboxyvinyltransferase
MKQPIRQATAPIRAHIEVPGSKSITNRALLLAALADGVSELSGILLSDDTLALIQALQQLGIVVQVHASTKTCVIAGCQGRFPKTQATIDCKSAGTVARFLLAAAAASPGVYLFDGSAQLRARPLAQLLQILKKQGAKFEPDQVQQLPFTLYGAQGLYGGEIEISSSETSQYLSAMLMIAPFAKNSVILTTHDVVSQPFIDMTCAMMGDFGVLVRRMHNARYSVPAPQRYHARSYEIEPDISTASYFFAAAAVTAGSVTIKSIHRDTTKQGDIAFLTVLQKMGCVIHETETGLTVQGPEVLRGIDVDMLDFSDTFMTLAAIAPFATTPTMITNIAHTRSQESDRISVMRKGLETLNIQVEEGRDWIKIFPSKPVGGIVDAHHDHRIAMAFAIVGLRVEGVEIEGAECVTKTCPQFFTLWESLLQS